MKTLFLLVLFVSVGLAQPDLQPARLFANDHQDTTWTLWKTGAADAADIKQDSVLTRPALGMLRFSVFNPSTTDTLKIALCLTWADTTSYLVVPPNSDWFNYASRDAGWVKFIAFAASDTLLGRIINWY